MGNNVCRIGDRSSHGPSRVTLQTFVHDTAEQGCRRAARRPRALGSPHSGARGVHLLLRRQQTLLDDQLDRVGRVAQHERQARPFGRRKVAEHV